MAAAVVCHQPQRKPVACVIQVPPLQNAHGRHVIGLYVRIVGQPVVGPRFLLVIMDMRVARVPARFRQVDPSCHLDLQIDYVLAGYLDNCVVGCVLGATFHANVDLAPVGLDLEYAVTVEERGSRPALLQAARRLEKTAVGRHHVDFGGQSLA